MFKGEKTHLTKKRAMVSPFGLFKAFVLLSGILFFGYVLVVGFAGVDAAIEPDVVPFVETQDADYSHFSHSNQAHIRLPCLICHTRNDNSPRIAFPGKTGHLPCASCHTVQFSSNTSPMCTICHTDTGMKRFPGLRSFGAKFDHSGHTKVNCVVCHKSGSRGVARSIPSGPSAHVTCFQCHSAQSSNAMASCNACHLPGQLVRTPEWAASFRKGFSHAKHLDNMNCAACHAVTRNAARGKQMSSPLASMHFAPERSQSCGGCHSGKGAFGPDDFTNCKRCHNTGTFKF
jgi:c(7)-type cytochrome triheme protein